MIEITPTNIATRSGMRDLAIATNDPHGDDRHR
jgi:hypothetical protein